MHPGKRKFTELQQNIMNQETQNQPVDLFDFQKERNCYDTLISAWVTEKNKVIERRKLRENKRNVAEERTKQTILEDETIIPDRTIDLNIRRGKTSYIAYVTQAKNILTAVDINNPGRDTETLQLWFTRGMKFPNWATPWLKLIDCMHVHGGASMEVIYDPEKPLNCSLEYIPREHLIIPLKTRDIQALPRLLRKWEITTVQLEEFSETYGFDPEVTKKITKLHENKGDFITIYRVLCKKNGIVYNAWYSPDDTTTFLRAPKPHEIGLFEFDPAEIGELINLPDFDEMRGDLIKPLFLRQYPITWFPYELTEDEELLAGQGRVALDLHVQEALTQLLTNTVNATTRAAQLYPTAESEPGQDGQLQELGRIKPGIVMNRKISLNNFPWPNPIILAVTQVLDVRKAQDSGHADFASTARKDANKTATEMELAQQQSNEQAGVNLGVFASPFLNAYALCFSIAMHQAIFNLCQRPPHIDDLFQVYHLTPAGDTEVLKRLEDRNNAKEFFNIIRGTPAADKLLEFLLQHFFPDQADEWIQILHAPNKDEIIMQLVNVLQHVPTDELTPEQQQGLQSIITAAQGVVTGSNNQGAINNPQSAEAGPAPISNEMQQTNAR